MRSRFPFLALSLVATLLPALSRAHATPIEYTFSFFGDGAAQGTFYSPANIVVSLFGDTNDISFIQFLGVDFYTAGPLTSTVSFDGHSYALDAVSLNLIYDPLSAQNRFDIQNSIGDEPDTVPNPPFYMLGYTNGPVILQTFPGNLTYADDPALIYLTNRGSATFNAFDPVAPIPEPSNIALLATGLLGVASVVKRRFV